MSISSHIAIIPARYASSRLPGKPLVDICGKSLIRRVWERVAAVVPAHRIYVATDDARIVNEVEKFGGQTLLTDVAHTNGTTRCLEAALMLESSGLSFDYVMNIQGDEPLMEPSQIVELANVCTEKNAAFATLVMPVVRREDLENESEVFVVFSKDMKALYFSRSVIPHLRGIERDTWFDTLTFYKHIGLYAYTLDTLRSFANMDAGQLEQAESLEQLRWLENGGEIFIGITEHDSLPVDTPEDLERVRKIISAEL